MFSTAFLGLATSVRRSLSAAASTSHITYRYIYSHTLLIISYNASTLLILYMEVPINRPISLILYKADHIYHLDGL